MDLNEKKRIVRDGYDKIAGTYHRERYRYGNLTELNDFAALLPESAEVLDVGCGAGVPVSRSLVEMGFRVTGIDVAESMIILASQNVPQTRFLRMDMTQLGFAENSFDGLTAFYSIIHVPKELHSEIFSGFHDVLRPGGIMLVTMGPDEWESTESYMGAKMFWSHYGPQQSLGIIEQSGFNIIFDRHLLNDADERHYWILAENIK